MKSLSILSALALGVAPAFSAPAGNKPVIIQMFEWNWPSIASECTNFIGPAGYGYVQVSPPNEHITGTTWTTDYQPVSYNITSKRGTRSQYQSMVKTCNAAGVNIIADAVLNHMSNGQGSGVAGDTYTKYNYPALGYTTNKDFHHCGGDGMVENYENATNVWECELGGLPDFATNSSDVRTKEAAYLNDLISLGTAGFRLDAAKHIPPADIANITSRLTNHSVYITQEVIYGGPQEAVQPSMYTGNGDIMEFRFGTNLRSAFLTNGISSIQNLTTWGFTASSGANVFVADHDTERDGTMLNYTSPGNTYAMGHVFMMAYPYGTPTVLSSYQFTTYSQGAPNNNTGTCSGTNGTNGWLCQHRWPAVANMVKFRNAVGSQTLNNWQQASTNQVAWGRGSVGFVALNNKGSSWSTTFKTSLPSGTYCDLLSGNVTAGSGAATGTCTGSKFTVSSGTFTATVPAYSGIAIYTGSQASTSASVKTRDSLVRKEEQF